MDTFGHEVCRVTDGQQFVTPEHFIKKWMAADLSERSAAQQHFLDLCALLGEPTPAEADPDGDTYTFEKGGKTAIGGHGWADVWKKGAFAWEYKGPGKDLNTLTNLYNTNPVWLQRAHRELDEAVAAAYGWAWPLADEEFLKRLFELNQTRAGHQARAR